LGAQHENDAFPTLAPRSSLDLVHQHQPFDAAADGCQDRIGHLGHAGERLRLRFRA
jgi:hypothetical protein